MRRLETLLSSSPMMSGPMPAFLQRDAYGLPSSYLYIGAAVFGTEVAWLTIVNSDLPDLTTQGTSNN